MGIPRDSKNREERGETLIGGEQWSARARHDVTLLGLRRLIALSPLSRWSSDVKGRGQAQRWTSSSSSSFHARLLST